MKKLLFVGLTIISLYTYSLSSQLINNNALLQDKLLIIDTQETSMLPAGTEEVWSKYISGQILKGSLDDKDVAFPVDLTGIDIRGWETAIKYDGNQAYVIVNSTTWPIIPQKVKDVILKALISYYGVDYITAYIPSIDINKNDLTRQEMLVRLGIQISSLPAITPIEQLFSPYAQQWAYKDSLEDGPNCFHTSMASIFPNWTNHRFMNAAEYSCHIKKSFKPIAELEQVGDLISIVDKKNDAVHGFTFIGVDSKNPNIKIVFSKNGTGRGYYLFMSYDDVIKIYGGNPTFYRALKNATDPSNNPFDHSLDCSEEYNKNMLLAQIQKADDPIINYGLKIKPPKTFAPLKIQ